MPPKMNKSYKCCAVPLCGNTTVKTPNKLFIHVPNKMEKRIKWLNLARRDPKSLSPNSGVHFCEDHFDLPNDMENYMVYHVLGYVGNIQLKPDCLPSKFSCQLERIKSCPEQPYIIVKKHGKFPNDKSSHAQFCDTLKGKSTDTKMNENIVVKCEKDRHFVYQIIKEEIPNDDGFDKGENKTINKQADKGTERHKEESGYTSKVETLVNKKFAIAIKAQNYTFQLEPLRNVQSEIPNSQLLNCLNTPDSSYDGSLNEEGMREVKKEAEDESEENNEVMDYLSNIHEYEIEVNSTMNSRDDNFELDIKPKIEDLSITFTGQEIENYKDGLTNVKKEDINTIYLDTKPVLIQDVYDTGQELNHVISSNKLNNSMITDLGKALKTHSVTEKSVDDIKPVIKHDNYDSAQEFNDLKRDDELSNFNTTQSGNTQKSHASEPKRKIGTEKFNITRNKEKFEPLNKRAKGYHQDVSETKIKNADILPEKGLVSVVTKKRADNVIKRKKNSNNVKGNNFNRNNVDKTKKLKTKLSNSKKAKWNSDKTNKVKRNK